MPSRIHILLELQLEGLEQLLGGVQFVPETGQNLYWSTMHSSAALELNHQRGKNAAGTLLQTALEEMLAYFWAKHDPNTSGCRTVTIVQRASRQHNADFKDLQWFALKDKVLQDAVLQYQGIVCTELTRLGYMLSYSCTGTNENSRFPLKSPIGDLHTGYAGLAVYLDIMYS